MKREVQAYLAEANKGELRYLSPKEGTMATISFPLFSGFLANSMAAAIAAPLLMPVSRPCNP